MILPEALTTPHLDLCKPESVDAASLYASCFSDPGVMRYLTWKLHPDRKVTGALLAGMRDRWERSTQAHWVVHVKGGERGVGIVSLRLESRANLSYLLARGQWGKGFMTEAAGEVCRWALEQQDIEELWAFCLAENSASVRVLARIGFADDGVLPHYAVFPNIGEAPMDCLLFTRRRP